jgi:hypothetical protein
MTKERSTGAVTEKPALYRGQAFMAAGALLGIGLHLVIPARARAGFAQ